jgi:hypothetical protein
MDLRVGIVSTVAPRLMVLTPARSDIALSGVTLLIRYIGQPVDSAQYAPISTTGGTTLLFQFDSLLFNQPFGFYEGTLQFNGVPYAQFQFRYTADTSISSALQISTTEPYTPPIPYATPNWSGTGIGGPGTFVGLKDCPKQYGGYSGYIVVVNTTETGLTFLPVNAGGVGSLNALTGAIVLAAGTNVTLTPAGNTITIAAASAGFANPMTNQYDQIIGGVSGAATRFATANNGVWATGNTGAPAWAARLPAVNFPALTGDVTTVAGTLATALAASGVAPAVYGDSTHVGQFTVDAKGRITSAANVAITVSGSGTVTSVGLTVPGALFGVSGSPVTSAGTLALSLLTQAANTVLAGPVTGAAAAPTMRALVAADIPARVSSPVTVLTNSAGVVNVDCSLGDYYTLTLAANVTNVTFSNLPAAGFGTSKFIRFLQDATGSRTVVFPASFKAMTGSITAVIASAAAYTDLAITSVDQGVRWEYCMQQAAA